MTMEGDGVDAEVSSSVQMYSFAVCIFILLFFVFVRPFKIHAPEKKEQ